MEQNGIISICEKLRESAGRNSMKEQKTPSCYKPSWTEGPTENAEPEIGLTACIIFKPTHFLNQVAVTNKTDWITHVSLT